MNWEYDCKYLWQNVSDQENRNKGILNSYGLKGWELVSVDNGVAYFKRKIGDMSNSIITRVVANKEDGN